MIKAITFDLWDTVIRDDSDEPKRAAAGLPSKREARRELAWQALSGSGRPRESVILAYDVMEAAFNHVWHEQHVTWTVGERVAVLAAGLGATLADADHRALIAALEEMEIDVAPDPVDGIGTAIEALAGRFRLGVVSDAIYTPGRCLREWLRMHGLEAHFGGFAFSDEIGHAKPHRSMFASVAAQLGVEVHEMIHIGDRDHNDVKGPHALGMKAILFTAARDRDRDVTSADAVCATAAEIPAAIEALAASQGA